MAVYEISNIQAYLIAKDERRTRTENNPYLSLTIDNGKGQIFVFNNRLPMEKWDELKVGKEYLFTVEESQVGTWSLRKFEEVEVNEIFI